MVAPDKFVDTLAEIAVQALVDAFKAETGKPPSTEALVGYRRLVSLQFLQPTHVLLAQLEEDYFEGVRARAGLAALSGLLSGRLPGDDSADLVQSALFVGKTYAEELFKSTARKA